MSYVLLLLVALFRAAPRLFMVLLMFGFFSCALNDYRSGSTSEKFLCTFIMAGSALTILLILM